MRFQSAKAMGRFKKTHWKGMLSYCQGLIQLSVSIDANIGEEFHGYCNR
jgi:hypothetical protein